MHSFDRVLGFLSQWLLDFAIGMYVYTYPAIRDRIDFVLSRPSDFVVSEVVNHQSMAEVFSRMEATGGGDTRDGCRESAAYVVRKVGLDSMELCNILKRVLRCRKCTILGLKDARAVAYQLVLLRSCGAVYSQMNFRRRGAVLNARLWLCGGIDVASIKNRFKITLKLVPQNSMDSLSKRIEILRKYGYTVLNFFGYQRFGSRRPVTHLIGKKLIYRDWEGFVDALCSYPFPTESRESIKCRLQWRDVKSGGLYPRGSIEARVCAGDIDNPLKLIRTIPKNVLQLYVNAYQSYLFNVILSRVWIGLVEERGLRDALAAIKGDLQYLPIPGASTVECRGAVRSILDEVLGAEDIKLSDFCIEELNLCTYGDYRRSYMTIDDLNYRTANDLVELTFTLESGCYATIVLREILNANPLLYT